MCIRDSYNIETGTFYRSEEPVERYAFSSEWQVLLDSQDSLRVYHNRNDSDILSSFAARVLITDVYKRQYTNCTGPPI